MAIVILFVIKLPFKAIYPLVSNRIWYSSSLIRLSVLLLAAWDCVVTTRLSASKGSIFLNIVLLDL